MKTRMTEIDRSDFDPRCFSILVLFATVVILMVSGSGFGESANTQIESISELPVHSYPLSGSVVEMMKNPDKMAELRSAMRRDLKLDLASDNISDVTALQKINNNLARLDLIDGDYASALAALDRVRDLEDKEVSKLMKGIVARALIAAKTSLPVEASQSEFEEIFRSQLHAMLFGLPWELVQDEAKDVKARAEFMSENLLFGIAESQVQPAFSAMGELSSELADTLIRLCYTIDVIVPLNPIVAEVYGEYIAKNQSEKINIWPAREKVLNPTDSYSPVVVAIWDAGVDVEVFKNQLFINHEEKKNGLDDDGNGFVDDINGIAFDLDGRPTSKLLLPLGHQAEKVDGLSDFVQGFWDMTSAIDSPAASVTRQSLVSMASSEVGDFLDTLALFVHFMHGTHVAGIAVDGNPFARILVSRLTFDHRQAPQAMNMEIAQRLVEAFAASAAYFKNHGVRVVNMSWGFSFKEIESSLEANGVCETAEERVLMARKLVGVLADGLRYAITATPEILYVTAAGNDDSDVDFDVVIPSSFDLPNLVVVGALDQSGDPTSFTSGGKNVKLYANGYRVESFVPGGRMLKGSGTSMAAPAVSNLAAKLFAQDPTLTLDQVVSLITNGADAHPDHPNILRINPLKTTIR